AADGGMNESRSPCTIANGTRTRRASDTGGSGFVHRGAMLTPRYLAATRRPGAVRVRSAANTARALRGRRHCAGQLTVTRPAMVSSLAAYRNAAIAPIDAPT